LTTLFHFPHAIWSKRLLFTWHRPNVNGFENTWTPGKSIYADKDTLQASNQWTFVDVVVTIGGVIPAEGATVTLYCADPPNASVPRAPSQVNTPDNYGGTKIFGSLTKSVG